MGRDVGVEECADCMSTSSGWVGGAVRASAERVYILLLRVWYAMVLYLRVT